MKICITSYLLKSNLLFCNESDYGNRVEPSAHRFWAEGSDKRPSHQYLRPNLRPIYQLPGAVLADRGETCMRLNPTAQKTPFVSLFRVGQRRNNARLERFMRIQWDLRTPIVEHHLSTCFTKPQAASAAQHHG